MSCDRQLVFSDAELLVVDALWPLDTISCSAGFGAKVSNSFASSLVSDQNTCKILLTTRC